MESQEIKVHPLSDNPDIVWDKIKKHQKKQKLYLLDPSTPICDEKLRIVCISDTHSVIENTEICHLPSGDILLHAGDFSNIGRPVEIQRFNEFLGKMTYKVKIVIAGNHDMTFDDEMVKTERKRMQFCFQLTEKILEEKLNELNISSIKDILTNCIYLEDKSVDICGIKLYGTPWQPEFCGWGFNLKRGKECLDKWNMIPDDTDILMSHGPPLGYGDECKRGNRVGCVELLSTVQKRVKPKYHIFGHIHEDYGVTTDGLTTFINASTCTLQYKPTNPPIVFDFPIPEGHSKSELAQLIP